LCEDIDDFFFCIYICIYTYIYACIYYGSRAVKPSEASSVSDVQACGLIRVS
jgi:hypothetical protein